jgi:aminoglycoside phosphotransferase (APT) family kinase protein
MTRDEWLEQHHARWNTPDELLARVLAEASPAAPVVSKTRLLIGEANETWQCTLDDGRSVLVKVAHGDPQRFECLDQMATLMSRAVPVPDVLFTGQIDVPGSGSSGVAVQGWLSGTPLHSIVEESQHGVEDLVMQAGETLARIHLVPVADPGTASDEKPLASPEADRALKCAAELDELLGDVELRLLTAQVARWFEAHVEMLAAEPVCLTHGDYGTDHLLVDEGRITGVVDLDSAALATPLRDLAWWDQYCDVEPHPLSLLLEGYRSVRADLDLRALDVFNMAQALSTLRYHADVRLDLDFMKRRLIQLLERVGA